jgi:hypothetical protein
VKDRQLAKHDRPLILNPLNAMLAELQEFRELQWIQIPNLWGFCPNKFVPSLFVISGFVDDPSFRKAFADM